MSLKVRLQEAQQRATLDAVRVSLEKGRRKVINLNHMLSQPYEFDSIVRRSGGSTIILLPVRYDSKTCNLENEIASAVSEALKSRKPEGICLGGYAGYELTKNTGRLPNSLDLEVRGVRVKINLERVEADLARLLLSQPGQDGQIRVRAGASVAAVPYIPSIKLGEEFDVSLKTAAAVKYTLIPLPREARQHFPGYRVPFTIKYGDKEIVTHVASASKGTEVGALAGTFISKGMRQLYEDHPEIKQTRELRFRAVNPGKVYEVIGFGK